MKNRSLTVMSILLSLALLLPADPASAAGRSSKSIANTILNGKGAPKISVGIDGDFYIDTRSLLIYGPKKKGRWPVPTNLQGPTGPIGNPGKSGNDGKTISSASTTSGPQGPQGPVGPKGETGSPGANGAQGPAGPAGQDGAPGSAGPAGSSGGSGPAGATGAQGPAGATGATGAQGPAGPSEVTVVDIPEWILSSAMPFSYSNSIAIGNLVAGNSYEVKIHLSGVSAYNNLVLGLDLFTPDRTLKFHYSRDDFRFATYLSTQSIYTFDVHATVQAGINNSQLTVRVIDGLGDTGSSPLTLKGTAYITLVGSIR